MSKPKLPIRPQKAENDQEKAVTVHFNEMDEDGCFDCPKCQIEISPLDSNRIVKCQQVAENPLVLELVHCCGQRIVVKDSGP